MQPVSSPMGCVQPVSSPMACVAQAQPLQQWHFANGGQYCGVPMQNGIATCLPGQMQGCAVNDGSMQFGVMQMQQPPQMAVPVNMQQYSKPGNSTMQGTPFPMPLSPPHDLAQTSFPGTQPAAYYENGGMQLVSVPVNSCPQ